MLRQNSGRVAKPSRAQLCRWMRSFTDMTIKILWLPILKFCLQFAFVATKCRNAQTTIPQSPVGSWGFAPSNQRRPCERTDHMLHANNQFVRISLVVRALYLRQRITTKRRQQMVALDPRWIAGQTPWRRRNPIHLRKMAFVNGRGDGAVLVYYTLLYISTKHANVAMECFEERTTHNNQ